ncbi:MAG: TonB-dependent receptor [Gemmatimonadota bacterium]
MTIILLAIALLTQPHAQRMDRDALQAQRQGTVFGWVRAQGSLEPIPFASVEVVGRTANTDEHGYYVIAGVAAGPVTVRAAMIGYATTEVAVTVPEGGSARADLALPTAAVGLEAIVVSAGLGESEGVTAGPPPVRIDAATLEYVPALAEKDALRAIQILPSIAAGSDFSSALYIRGGSPDQSVVLVDGAPVFNPYHLGGIFSAIDPDAIATIEVLPGGMPAAEADRASGVVKVWTPDGGRDRVRGHGAVGLVSSRLGIDGPLPGGRGSYLISGRRTYFDLTTKAAYELDLIETPFPYSFTDAHLKLAHDIGRTGRLSVAGYVNDERIHTPREVEPDSRTAWSWGTRAASATYRQPLGASIMADINLAATSFDGDFDVVELQDQLADTLFLGDITMRDIVGSASLTWYGARHQLTAGAQLDDYAFRYDFLLGVGQSEAGDPTGDDFGGEDLFSGLERDDDLTTFAAGRYAQAIQSLRDEESVLASVMPYELLVPAEPDVGFTTADDVVLGVEYGSPDTRLRVEGYVKRYPNLAIPPLAPDPVTVSGSTQSRSRSSC